jgi:hypothetical protein
MNYEKKQELIKEFKAATKNKAFNPTIDTQYGNKYEGKLHYLHYMFYAMLRNKNIELITHDIESPKFKIRKLQLLSFVKDTYQEINKIQCNSGVYCNTNLDVILKSLTTVFPSLTKEEIIEIVTKYQ